MKPLRILVLAFLLGSHFGALAQINSGALYATGNKDTELLTIDLSSQAVSIVGPMGYPFSFALAISPTDTAYTITNLFNATHAQLATVDLNTGAATLVGGPLGENLSIMGVSVSPDGTLYGAAMPATAIYSINTTSGLPSFVGSSTTTGELMSFAYAPDGTLYSASPTSLYTVDLTSGSATFVTPLAVGGVMGIAIDDNGAMYATNFVGCPPCSSVYQIDPATGAATLLFNTGIPFIHNIAFNPGTPADQLAVLAARINSLRLLGGIGTSLNAKVSAALNAVNSGDSVTACNILGAFQNEVDALAGTMITATGVRQLTFASARLRTALGCQ